MYMQIIDIHNCYTCNRQMKLRTHTCIDDYTGLPSVKIFVNCAECRHLLKRQEKLERKLLDISWILYTRLHRPDYFEE